MAVRQIRKMVRFFDTVIVDRNENIVRIQPGYWPELRQQLAGMKPADRESRYHEARYVGVGRRAVSPAAEYVLFGHVRDRADWPSTYNEETGDFGTLSVPGEGGAQLALAEGTYVLDVPGTNIVAMLSAGRLPNLSAIQDWLATVTGTMRDSHSIELLPVLDENAQQKLERATGVAKIDVRVPRGTDASGLAEDGVVGEALSRATAATHGAMDVELTLSMGHGHAPQNVQGALLRGLRAAVGSRVNLNKARATLLVPDADGVDRREAVDFIRQRVAYPVKMNVDRDDVISEESALRGMLRAIDRFHEETL